MRVDFLVDEEVVEVHEEDHDVHNAAKLKCVIEGLREPVTDHRSPAVWAAGVDLPSGSSTKLQARSPTAARKFRNAPPILKFLPFLLFFYTNASNAAGRAWATHRRHAAHA